MVSTESLYPYIQAPLLQEGKLHATTEKPKHYLRNKRFDLQQYPDFKIYWPMVTESLRAWLTSI